MSWPLEGTGNAGVPIQAGVNGSPVIGNVLTFTAPPGLEWTAQQWYRDGVAISGATAATYTYAAADVGKSITVELTGLGQMSAPLGVAPAGSGSGFSPSVSRILPFSLGVGGSRTFQVNEGDNVTLVSGSGAAGTLTRVGGNVVTLGTGTYITSALSGVQTYTLGVTAGSISAVVGDAVLGAVQINNQAPNTVVVQNPITGATAAIAKPGGFERGGYALSGALNSGATPNSTWCHATCAWGPFNRVKLVFSNASANSETVDLFSVAASTTLYPSGVNNIAQPQGGGAMSAAVAGPVVPAATGPFTSGYSRLPSRVVTDWINCRSLTRAAGELDGGLYELLLTRVYFASGNTNTQYLSLNSAMGGASWDMVNEGFSLQFARAPSGDKVTVPGSLTSLTREANNPIVTLHGIIFDYDQSMYYVINPGDSTWKGDLDGVTNNCGGIFKAVARVRKSGKMVSFTNCGITNSTAQEINTRGRGEIDLYNPDLIIIQCYTINSATATQADWDAQWDLFKDLAKYQLSKGKQVLMVTPLPNGAFTSTINVYRLKQRQRVINSGLPYADVEAALVDVAGGQGRFLTGMAADASHLTPLGNETFSGVLQPVIAALAP